MKKDEREKDFWERERERYIVIQHDFFPIQAAPVSEWVKMWKERIQHSVFVERSKHLDVQTSCGRKKNILRKNKI